MLRELRVRNFAIVEDGELKIGTEMTAFTGETGAGKSLLFDAVTLLLGGKARSELVRTGESSGEVEGVFDLSGDPTKRVLAESLGFATDEDEGHMLIVRREIASTDRAKNRVWIQGRSATRAQLQQLLGDWVEISGQHEFLRLGREDYLLGTVDQFGGLREEVRVFEGAYEAHRMLAKEVVEARTAHRDRETRLEFLRFQVEEMERAGIGPEAASEEERLLALRARLGNLERVRRTVEAAREALDGGEGESDSPGAANLVSRAVRELNTLAADFGAEFGEFATRLASAEEVVADVSHGLSRLAGTLEDDPEALEQAEAKLSLLNRLKRKHGAELADLAAKLADAKSELSRVESSGERLAELEEKLNASLEALSAQASKLHERRVKAAAELSKRWEKDLRQLGMKQARLELKLSKLEEFGASGQTGIEALFSANSGESPKSLGKVASGGELSRILLSLKHIVAGRSEIGIYLFDEVDSGIGGETAHAVAARLRGIAEENQVIVVTHLAQIAAVAHDQFRIRKDTIKGRTRTVVEKLPRAERESEIARMLGGTSSGAAKKLAREMLEASA